MKDRGEKRRRSEEDPESCSEAGACESRAAAAAAASSAEGGSPTAAAGSAGGHGNSGITPVASESPGGGSSNRNISNTNDNTNGNGNGSTPIDADPRRQQDEGHEDFDPVPLVFDAGEGACGFIGSSRTPSPWAQVPFDPGDPLHLLRAFGEDLAVSLAPPTPLNELPPPAGAGAPSGPLGLLPPPGPASGAPVCQPCKPAGSGSLGLVLGSRAIHTLGDVAALTPGDLSEDVLCSSAGVPLSIEEMMDLLERAEAREREDRFDFRVQLRQKKRKGAGAPAGD